MMRQIIFYFYRCAISPFLHLLSGPGRHCRFEPSCSKYAHEAVGRFGWFRGGWLALKRFLRCYPLGSFCWDPVPINDRSVTMKQVIGLVGLVGLMSMTSMTGAAPAFAAEKIKLDLKNSEAQVQNGTTVFQGWKEKTYNIHSEEITNRSGEVQFAFDAEEFVYLDGVKGTLKKQGDAILWNYEDDKVRLERRVSPTVDGLAANVRISAEFKKKRPGYAFVSLMSRGKESDPEEHDRTLSYFTNDEVERVMVTDEHEVLSIPSPMKWLAASNRYFTLAVLPSGDFLPRGVLQPVGSNGARMSLIYPVQGNQIEIPFRVTYGVKELTALGAVEPTLENLVDLGWFTFLAHPMLMLLKWFYSFVMNYGWAILLLTVLVKILTYPLTYKSMKSMRKMAELQPEVKRLQERYKNDREAMNREMISFMRDKGYNPMAGCWPILIQMPIFFALYQVLYSAVELYRAPFLFWLTDLSAPDPYYVMPVLVSVTWFLQQKLTPNTITDPTQRKIMQAMPIVFGLFMINLPSGLGVYFFANALLSIVQQLMLNKKLGPPPPVHANGFNAAKNNA